MTDPIFDPDFHPWCFEHAAERPLGSLHCDDQYATDRPCRFTASREIPGQLDLNLGER